MSSSDFTPYQVDHLFLLVGENPLPNYVAAKLLIRKKGTVYLVHSTRTKPECDKLDEVLKAEGIEIQPVSLASSEADRSEIRKKIDQALRPQGKNLQGRIGLNYTGGTKAMAVHVYQAIQDFKPASDESTVFSYLDSRTLQLFVDSEKAVPVGLAVPLRLNTLLELHNLSWDKNNPPIDQPQLSDAAVEFAKEFMKAPDLGKESRISGGWNRWCKVALQDAKYQEGEQKGFWKSEEELSALPDLSMEITKDNICLQIPNELRKILRINLGASTDTQIKVSRIREKLIDKKLGLQYVYHWLNGGWLEDYVLWQVQKLAQEKPERSIRDFKSSLHIKDPEFAWKKVDQFEFDVVFLRGYQLFAISCTTISDYKSCKQKLFEAQLRARQLGGDEARISLVCCYDGKTKKLRKELSLVVGTQKEEDKYDKRIEVFGRSDLEPKRFSNKLDKWIFRNT